MKFIKVKTILSKEKYGNEWFGIDYKMNLYRGCSHGCIYCDSRSNCYHIDNFDVPKGKENALYLLESELSKKHERENQGKHVRYKRKHNQKKNCSVFQGQEYQ